MFAGIVERGEVELRARGSETVPTPSRSVNNSRRHGASGSYTRARADNMLRNSHNMFPGAPRSRESVPDGTVYTILFYIILFYTRLLYTI